MNNRAEGAESCEPEIVKSSIGRVRTAKRSHWVTPTVIYSQDGDKWWCVQGTICDLVVVFSVIGLGSPSLIPTISEAESTAANDHERVW